jgi:hypothetical protein
MSRFLKINIFRKILPIIWLEIILEFISKKSFARKTEIFSKNQNVQCVRFLLPFFNLHQSEFHRFDWLIWKRRRYLPKLIVFIGG